MSADYDVVVVGGGPAGATAAHELALAGATVALLDEGGRIKPCGGAIPPRLVADFAIPDALLVARIRSARAEAPSGLTVDMPIDGGPHGAGYVGMVDRETFDEWLRARAAAAGAERIAGRFVALAHAGDRAEVTVAAARGGASRTLRARIVVGADGANSAGARAALPRERGRHVFAYHEIVAAPPALPADRCDIVYRGAVSPDFYGWVFPHGATASVGVGSARRGFAPRPAVAAIRDAAGLAGCDTIRREGAPIPLRPRRRWDDRRRVLLVGDAAGVVAPASGEGIYYAMASARMAVAPILAMLATGDARALARVRRDFLAEHGRVFRALGLLQAVWYRNDWLRERFVRLCRDPDVQRLTWDAYMNKRMVRRQHRAHLRLALVNLREALGARLEGWRARRA